MRPFQPTVVRGFFKINAHDDEHALAHFRGQRAEALGIFAARGKVVDRARTDDEEEARIFAGEDAADLRAGAGHEGGVRFAARDFDTERAGRGQGGIGDDVNVGDAWHEKGRSG